MSHFAVTVIGDNVEEQLAPYHEFECTGMNNEYVKDIDNTEAARNEWLAHTEARLKLKDGTLVAFFDDNGKWVPEYSQPVPDSHLSGISGERTYFVPEGCEKVEVQGAAAMSFADYCEGWYGHKIVRPGEDVDIQGKHKFGYVLVDEAGEVIKDVDRTNPNAKWDWYSVGGRWMGFFQLKPGKTGELGVPGVFDNDAAANTADVLRLGDIDFAKMRDDAAAKAAKAWDDVRAAAGDMTGFQTWDKVREACIAEFGDTREGLGTARERYNGQEQLKRCEAAKVIGGWCPELDDYVVDKDTYVTRARNAAGTTFAVVKDGVWYERGSMGWWGCVSDEKDQDKWFAEYAALLDGLPESTQITIVDCHI